MAATDWFSHDRFGMFIHWGLYSVPAGIWLGKKAKHNYSEWLQASEHIPREEYQQLVAQFNPQAFDADAWIREAKNAGMRYFLITAKHHEGFALWPTKASRYNVMDATPLQRDILGELAAACKKYDVKLGFYYSHWQDWEGTGGDICSTHMENEEYQHPSEEAFAHYWEHKCLVQVRELIENYDPAFFWFDTWNKDSYRYITAERQDELISLIRSLSEKCLINSRIQFLQPSERVDFISTMDNDFPDAGFAKPWETSGTLNDSWAYHKLDFDWKSTQQLLQNLIGNASLGGNYQLNVGPMGDGRFQDAAIKRLREIGAWLEVNGESIYGTQASPLGKMPWGRVTARTSADATRLYLHLWDVTPGTALFVDGVQNTPLAATVLESGQPVRFEAGENGIWLHLPKELHGLQLPVIALDVAGAQIS
ncbi:MAG TPA: alpha-L-fucosidase [Armatimonadota bacterium]|jgi:alpha-L-fucosidase